MSTLANDPRLIAGEASFRGIVATYRRRISSGDVGQLPVIIGLVVIWSVFGIASGGTFFTPVNLVNLSLQMAAVGTIAVGVVFVLLLGEIDLTVGVMSGLAAGIMAVLNVQAGLPGPLAVLGGLVAGLLVGAFHGMWITRFRIPSFVVTLAGLIAWQGVLLFVLGSRGTINLRDPFITGLAGTFFTGIWAWVIGAGFVVYVGGTAYMQRRNRVAAGLSGGPTLLVWARTAISAAVVALAIVVLSQDRGLPLSLVLLVGLVVVMDFVARRTRFGRMVFAVGGNAEAARRAGIPVDRVRVAVFIMASTFAAWGGILAASRLLAVTQSSGSGDVLLNAIASAVIGGTSLFGGRGTAWAALLGILVIQSISNGMDLLSFEPAIKLTITGAVLLTAVTIDALARRGREQH
ncbi:MAG: sugar ABC transporter permease [Chloroflexi bacterium]|nr:sugar ABC transporter permease [Chloroflexota bacterium]